MTIALEIAALEEEMRRLLSGESLPEP